MSLVQCQTILFSHDGFSKNTLQKSISVAEHWRSTWGHGSPNFLNFFLFFIFLLIFLTSSIFF